jgi:hypothetical protein
VAVYERRRAFQRGRPAGCCGRGRSRGDVSSARCWWGRNGHIRALDACAAVDQLRRGT